MARSTAGQSSKWLANILPTMRRVNSGTRRFSIAGDRKSTRLNSSHANISYAVFCLEKQNTMLNATAAYPAATEPWLHLGGRGAWAVVPRWTSMHPEHAFQRVLLSIM